MKKHLLGLGIFSFIIVSFAVAFAFLYAKPEICNLEVTKKPVVQTDKRKSCDYSKRRNVDSSCKFTQATLQKNSHQFNALIECDDIDRSYNLELHFFINNGGKTEFAVTEMSEVKQVNINGKSYWEVETNLREWANKYNRKSNFYVMSEFKDIRFSDDEVKFDANKAVSVLWVESPVVEKTVKSRDSTKILQ